ncbi:hypothetical protein CDCA_CDCA11G3308 [Cyanidium caldarium]|uniref:Uncharacterized protein n=1 Tax=Cyanidium caldarium TaxID=2771 RepID=A0AAV9IY89_CYACA|nr:hypothetical protein CDCA_CDCA11G3308 [Cyanidium caldarium]
MEWDGRQRITCAWSSVTDEEYSEEWRALAVTPQLRQWAQLRARASLVHIEPETDPEWIDTDGTAAGASAASESAGSGEGVSEGGCSGGDEDDIGSEPDHNGKASASPCASFKRPRRRMPLGLQVERWLAQQHRGVAAAVQQCGGRMAYVPGDVVRTELSTWISEQGDRVTVSASLQQAIGRVEQKRLCRGHHSVSRLVWLSFAHATGEEESASVWGVLWSRRRYRVVAVGVALRTGRASRGVVQLDGVADADADASNATVIAVGAARNGIVAVVSGCRELDVYTAQTPSRSPDAAADSPPTVLHLQLRQQARLPTLHRLVALDVSPSGRYIAALSASGTLLVLRNTATTASPSSVAFQLLHSCSLAAYSDRPSVETLHPRPRSPSTFDASACHFLCHERSVLVAWRGTVWQVPLPLIRPGGTQCALRSSSPRRLAQMHIGTTGDAATLARPALLAMMPIRHSGSSGLVLERPHHRLSSTPLDTLVLLATSDTLLLVDIGDATGPHTAPPLLVADTVLLHAPCVQVSEWRLLPLVRLLTDDARKRYRRSIRRPPRVRVDAVWQTGRDGDDPAERHEVVVMVAGMHSGAVALLHVTVHPVALTSRTARSPALIVADLLPLWVPLPRATEKSAEGTRGACAGAALVPLSCTEASMQRQRLLLVRAWDAPSSAHCPLPVRWSGMAAVVLSRPPPDTASDPAKAAYLRALESTVARLRAARRERVRERCEQEREGDGAQRAARLYLSAPRELVDATQHGHGNAEREGRWSAVDGRADDRDDDDDDDDDDEWMGNVQQRAQQWVQQWEREP